MSTEESQPANMDEAMRERARELLKPDESTGQWIRASSEEYLAEKLSSVQAESTRPKEFDHDWCMKQLDRWGIDREAQIITVDEGTESEAEVFDRRGGMKALTLFGRLLKMRESIQAEHWHKLAEQARAQGMREAAEIPDKYTFANPSTDFERGIRSACHLIKQHLLNKSAAIERAAESQKAGTNGQ